MMTPQEYHVTYVCECMTSVLSSMYRWESRFVPRIEPPKKTATQELYVNIYVDRNGVHMWTATNIVVHTFKKYCAA
jgi:hypothetical protein